MSRCLVCNSALARARMGRPRKYCAKERCQDIATKAKDRRLCGRCRCPVLWEDERLTGLCRPCREEVVKAEVG